jgi:CRP/FNR family cyclic AMP-dependent transcriptional regulator
MNRMEFLKHVPLFAGLNDAELQALAADLVARRFAAGETIFCEGDVGQALYLVAVGQVRIFVHGEGGQEASVTWYGSGEFFGELALIDAGPRSASAAATRDTLAYVLGRDCFHAHMRRSPQLAWNFLEALSVRVRNSTRQVGSLSMLDIPGRLARKLLDLAQAHGEPAGEDVRIRLVLTQSDLASLIGATRESINKVLGAFRRKGLIRMERGHIVVIDRARLVRLVDGTRE